MDSTDWTTACCLGPKLPTDDGVRDAGVFLWKKKNPSAQAFWARLTLVQNTELVVMADATDHGLGSRVFAG